ncbi:hypothetical protein DQ04_00491040 [Trypanosoma grayi]|uniref:hypothetical protein n=1 Tax=Trypanosoma grayi TaxID=71804 RepID=UPI0004F3FCEF|nr:hypothetical protein DQ04_00491040 [Trypanosoma grayi]KEG14384.1 hypothetical protein DQ04_00491040 [Trypanosoma grayi]
MLRPTLSLAVRRTPAVFLAAAAASAAPAAGRVDPKKSSKAPQESKVNGATGPDGDSVLDKAVVAGCLSAVAAWFVFGPPIQSHH